MWVGWAARGVTGHSSLSGRNPPGGAGSATTAQPVLQAVCGMAGSGAASTQLQAWLNDTGELYPPRTPTSHSNRPRFTPTQNPRRRSLARQLAVVHALKVVLVAAAATVDKLLALARGGVVEEAGDVGHALDVARARHWRQLADGHAAQGWWKRAGRVGWVGDWGARGQWQGDWWRWPATDDARAGVAGQAGRSGRDVAEGRAGAGGALSAATCCRCAALTPCTSPCRPP